MEELVKQLHSIQYAPTINMSRKIASEMEEVIEDICELRKEVK